VIGAEVHGGDVRGIARAYGRPVDDFIDFSANINPLGPPIAVQTLVAGYAAAGFLGRYPEPGLPDLSAVLARKRGVDPENILIHGGSAALFDVILRACASRGLALCLPAFAEYARAAQANGLDVRAFP
jgi:threonine-phosphate decarboxylase